MSKKKTTTYRGYEISADGSPFEIEGYPVYIQHDKDGDIYYSVCNYREPNSTAEEAVRDYRVDIALCDLRRL